MSTLLRVTRVLALCVVVSACSGNPSGGGAPGDAAGTTAGDGGPSASPCSHAATPIGKKGGVVTSDDDRVRVTVPAGALTEDTAMRICSVPEARWSDRVANDGAGPIGDVYLVEPSDVTFAAPATLELAVGGATLAAITTAAGIEPLTLHHVSAADERSRLGDVVMELGAEPSLTGTLAQGGQVYARQVDDSGPRYIVDVDARAAPISKLTGEVFDLGTKLTVSGTPLVTRSLTLVTSGCDLEPMQPLGVEQKHVRAAGCEVEPVLRQGTDLTLAGAELGADAVIDLTTAGADVDADHVPPRLFCTHPGPATARVRLEIGVGKDRDVSVVATQRVTCTPSGDRLLLVDLIGATRLLHGPAVPTLSPFGTPLPFGDAQLMTDAARGTPFGADGLSYAPMRSNQTLPGLSGFRLAGPQNGATGALSTDVYTLTPTGNDTQPAYADAGGMVALQDAGGQPLWTLQVAGRAAIAAGFDAPPNALPAVTFADAVVDLVYVRGFDKADGQATRFERWIRPSSLPAARRGRRRAELLTEKQAVELAASSVTTFDIGLLNVSWDEARSFNATGRIAPLMGGVVIRVDASTLASAGVESPCVAAVASATTCKAGLRETLAVATETGVELFDPLDGHFLSTLVKGAAGPTNGFRQVVQGADGCVYASQQANGSNGDGVWRYKTDGTAMDAANDPYVALAEADDGESVAFKPRGLTFYAGDLFVANEAGGVLRFDVEHANQGKWLVDYLAVATSKPNSVFWAATADASRIYTTDVNGPVGAHAWVDSDLPALPAAAAGMSIARISTLTYPQQINVDAGALRDVMIASAGTHEVLLYRRSDQAIQKTIPFGTETPQGIYALLDGSWLVAGTDGLGVQTLMPGLVQQPKARVRETGDAYYISRLCLP